MNDDGDGEKYNSLRFVGIKVFAINQIKFTSRGHKKTFFTAFNHVSLNYSLDSIHQFPGRTPAILRSKKYIHYVFIVSETSKLVFQMIIKFYRKLFLCSFSLWAGLLDSALFCVYARRLWWVFSPSLIHQRALDRHHRRDGTAQKRIKRGKNSGRNWIVINKPWND